MSRHNASRKCGSRGSTGYRWRMRCCNTRKCGRRYTLRRHPDDYAYPARYWRCPTCGGPAYSDEMNRRRELAQQDTCHCLPFPHRRGSIMGCNHHPKPVDEWTDEDRRDYQDMLETPRGST